MGAKYFLLFSLLIAGPVLASEPSGLTFCELCVSFAGEALNLLVNYIANVAVVGSCEEICGIFGNQLLIGVCDIVCFDVGLQDFLQAIEDADLDPIYFCQLTDQCPHVNGGSATIVQSGVNPPEGPEGTVFQIDVVFNVTQPTGTGQIVSFLNKGEEEVGQASSLNVGFPVGVQGLRLQVDTAQIDQNGQFVYKPGHYDVITQICEGTCGSIHEWSAILATAYDVFDIKE